MKYGVRHIVYGLTYLAAVAASVSAGDAPLPGQIADSVKSMWSESKMSNLDSYISTLYEEHPTYVPAILAASFRDYIFLGKLPTASAKLNEIQQLVDGEADGFETDFKDVLKALGDLIQAEIKLHERKGTTPAQQEANADPQAVRNGWKDELPPPIEILFYAPATNTPAVKE